MISYLVYHKNNSEDILLEECFSWSASILGTLWVIYNKLWELLLLLVVIFLFLKILSYYDLASTEIIIFIKILINVMIGFFASDIKQWKLKKQSYVLENIVVAKNKDEAYLRYYNHYRN
jgi:hypothetical protein